MFMNKKNNTFRYIGRRITHILSVVAVLVALFPARGNAEDIFAALAGMTQVESTYVSGRWAHNQKYWRDRAGKYSLDLSRGFSALYSYQCYSTEAVNKAKQLLKDYLKNNPEVDLVSKTTGAGQEYMIYEKFDDNDNLVQMVVWDLSSSNACEIVVVDWYKGLAPTRSEYSLYEKGLEDSPAIPAITGDFSRGIEDFATGICDIVSDVLGIKEMIGRDID